MKRNKKTSVMLTGPQLEALQAHAKKECRSVSSLIAVVLSQAGVLTPPEAP